MNTLYASLYPNLITQFNIAANTQIGKVTIPDRIHDKENRRHNENWERAGSFFEDFHTHNWIIVGSKWFGLPNVRDMYDYVVWYFSHIVQPTCLYGFENCQWEMYQPIKFLDGGYAPITFNPPMNEEKIMEWREYVETHPNQSF